MGKTRRERYLRQHGSGDQWFFQLSVPKDVQSVVGKKLIAESMKTDSVTLARKRRDERLVLWRRTFDEIRQGRKVDKAKLNHTFKVAGTRARQHLELNAEHGAENLNDQLFADYGVDMYNDLLEPEEEARVSGVLNEIARFRLGQPALPPEPEPVGIADLVERWLAECHVTSRTKLQRRKALNDFADWAGSSAYLGSVGRKKAGEFILDVFIAKEAHHVTANEKIGALSLYWQWLIKRGHVESDPWSGQRLKQPKRHKNRTKRPYSDKELTKLLAGNPGQPLRDVIRISALSGMRLEEICLLTVAECREGVFRITKAKTSAGVREVPIHRDLAELVESRCGDDGSAYLIHELNDPPSDTMQRSHEVSKAFTRYRRKLDLDERPDGQRQSNIDFHSLRRWFITFARDAWRGGAKGYDPWVIADCVGHDRETLELAMTMGRYAGERVLSHKLFGWSLAGAVV